MGLAILYRPTSIPEKAGWEMGHLFLSTAIQTPVVAIAAGVFTSIGFTAGAVFGVTQVVVEYSLIRISNLMLDQCSTGARVVLKILSVALAVFAGVAAGIAVASLAGFFVTNATAVFLTQAGIIGVGLNGLVELFRVVRNGALVEEAVSGGMSSCNNILGSFFARYLMLLP